MPPITLLPAAAKLDFPDPSIMLAPLGSITEFLRAASFLVVLGPVLEPISDISPTLGSALELLNYKQVWVIANTNEMPRYNNFLTVSSYSFCAGLLALSLDLSNSRFLAVEMPGCQPL
jgi:hypothetical protein